MNFSLDNRIVRQSEVLGPRIITTHRLEILARSLVDLHTDLTSAREFLCDNFQLERAAQNLPKYEHALLQTLQHKEGKEFSIYLEEAQRAARLLELLKAVYKKDMASMILPF